MVSIQWPAGRAATIVSPICANCKRLEDSYYRECEAFDEIPDEIFDGLNDHRTPYPGDGGKRFVRFDESDPEMFQEPEPDEDPEVEVPDPDDDDLWERLERESNRRLGGKRSASELLLFARRPYDYDGQMSKRSEAFRAEMQGLAQQLREGKMSHVTWAQRSQEKIIVNTIDGYRLGVARARGVAPSKIKLTPEQRRAANVGMKDQLDYFAKFSKEVKGQSLEEMTSKVEARAALYHGGVRSASSQAELDEQGEKMLTWVRYAGDSCETCIKWGGETKRATEWKRLDVWPAHNVACHGNCRCGWSAAEE